MGGELAGDANAAIVSCMPGSFNHSQGIGVRASLVCESDRPD